jgi:hypothetical protein
MEQFHTYIRDIGTIHSNVRKSKNAKWTIERKQKYEKGINGLSKVFFEYISERPALGGLKEAEIAKSQITFIIENLKKS